MWFSLLISLFWLTSCEKTTTDPGPGDLQLSPAANEGLTSSWQTIHSLNSASEVSEIISGDLELEESDLGGIYSTSQMQSEFSKMKMSLKAALNDKKTEGIQSDDSLIWFIDWTDPISGVSVRKALYYDKLTGIARYYEAIYQFPPQLRLAYDSTEIKADLNFTLEDSLDDKFLGLYKFTDFKDGFFVEKIEANAEATEWDADNQVSGASLNNHVWYGEHIKIKELVQELQIHPDETGRIFEQLDYRDGTFLQKTVNFYANYTGDYSEIWRNGTQVSGTFDRLEDDNHASLTRVVDFPAGFFLNKIEQAADYTLNLEDSSSHVILNEKIFFTNGLLDTSQLIIDEFFENDLKKTHLVGLKSDGSQADLLVTHFSDYQEIEGNYTGPDGYYSLIEAILYSDGSGELWLKVYESEEAYLNGESPVATIYIHFNPDGSGGGEVTEGNVKYSVQVDQNGEMVVTDDAGKRQVINGF
jgi:hypothetical protein